MHGEGRCHVDNNCGKKAYSMTILHNFPNTIFSNILSSPSKTYIEGIIAPCVPAATVTSAITTQLYAVVHYHSILFQWWRRLPVQFSSCVRCDEE